MLLQIGYKKILILPFVELFYILERADLIYLKGDIINMKET